MHDVLKERIQKLVPTVKTIHKLFREQAVYRKGTKWNRFAF